MSRWNLRHNRRGLAAGLSPAGRLAQRAGGRGPDVFEALEIHNTLPAMNVGGGATGFVSDRWGLNWDVRYFRGSSRDAKGLSIGSERLSFWRASMAVVLR